MYKITRIACSNMYRLIYHMLSHSSQYCNLVCTSTSAPSFNIQSLKLKQHDIHKGHGRLGPPCRRFSGPSSPTGSMSWAQVEVGRTRLSAPVRPQMQRAFSLFELRPSQSMLNLVCYFPGSLPSSPPK